MYFEFEIVEMIQAKTIAVKSCHFHILLLVLAIQLYDNGFFFASPKSTIQDKQTKTKLGIIRFANSKLVSRIFVLNSCYRMLRFSSGESP